MSWDKYFECKFVGNLICKDCTVNIHKEKRIVLCFGFSLKIVDGHPTWIPERSDRVGFFIANFLIFGFSRDGWLQRTFYFLKW